MDSLLKYNTFGLKNRNAVFIKSKYLWIRVYFWI